MLPWIASVWFIYNYEKHHKNDFQTRVQVIRYLFIKAFRFSATMTNLSTTLYIGASIAISEQNW